MIYTYIEPGEDGVTPVVVNVTQEEILRTYYPWWAERMRAKGLEPTEAQCIEDWGVVHWAAPQGEK